MNIVNGWCVLILKKIWLGGTSFFFLAGSGGFALSPAGSSDIPTIQGRCSLDYNCKTNMDKSYHWTPTHTHTESLQGELGIANDHQYSQKNHSSTTSFRHWSSYQQKPKTVWKKPMILYTFPLFQKEHQKPMQLWSCISHLFQLFCFPGFVPEVWTQKNQRTTKKQLKVKKKSCGNLLTPFFSFGTDTPSNNPMTNKTGLWKVLWSEGDIFDCIFSGVDESLAPTTIAAKWH